MKTSTLPNNLFLVFTAADGFHEASRILSDRMRPTDLRGMQDRVNLIYPAIVNSAFTSELYLKCLAYGETSSAQKTHDLRKLFANLAEATRMEILQAWDRRVVAGGLRVKLDLLHALDDGANAFEETRYPYEPGGLKGFALFYLPEVLRDVVIAKHPEWPEWLDRLKAMPIKVQPL